MTDTHRRLGFATKAIHAGYRPDPATGAVNAPIYASSTFAQDGVGGLRGGFEYARTGNPTRAALEAVLAAVEEGRFGRAFSSGMAATDCALRAVLRPGDHIVIPDGVMHRQFQALHALIKKSPLKVHSGLVHSQGVHDQVSTGDHKIRLWRESVYGLYALLKSFDSSKFWLDVHVCQVNEAKGGR